MINTTIFGLTCFFAGLAVTSVIYNMFVLPKNKEKGEVKTNHDLKILPKYYSEVAAGRKLFEIRKNDRGFQVGDTVMLKEYDDTLDQQPTFGSITQGKVPKGYTGKRVKGKITYITDYEQKPGYVVFGIKLIKGKA
ncbi:DUF3850 domain-containing protein [Parasalinivibrio latis]|uniref:DUF3850 domain-containing protein n=1 Tax=Parasalinivibrio latis TaxID=2952610 RepID=UPI0030E26424